MTAPVPQQRIVITGAAGLVGQNLVTLLREQGFTKLLAIDKHADNLAILQRLHPQVQTLHADLAEPGPWERAFDGADVVVQLHAQIAGKTGAPFDRNNLDATRQVLRVLQDLARGVPGACQLVGRQFGGRGSLRSHQDRAGTAGARSGRAPLRAAADLDVRLVRSEAPGLAGTVHGTGAVLPPFRDMAATCASRSTTATSAAPSSA